MNSIYLDIETRSFGRSLHYISVVGFYHRETGLRQIIWPDITAEILAEALPPADHIYTYNGNMFDIKVIEQHLGVDLAGIYESRDLMRDCWQRNLRGGLKSVERQLGISRTQPPLNNYQIQDCWTKWKHKGDEDALAVLLKYNEEDVMNLLELRGRLGV